MTAYALHFITAMQKFRRDRGSGGGLPGGSINGGGKGGRMDMLVDSLLAYRANAPVIDQLLTEAGLGTS
jgi:hypothetical protein